MDVISIALILGGLVLLFVGAALSNYGVAVTGMAVGGGTGYLVAPTVGAAAGLGSPVAIVVAVLGGIVAGVLLTRLLFSFAVGGISLLVGLFVGLTVVVPLFVTGAWYVEIGVAIAVAMFSALLGLVLTKTMMVVITAFVGSLLASQSITAEQLLAAQANVTMEPLFFEPTAPVFVGLFVLGVLTQFGLFKFGYVAKLLKILPGGRALRNRGEKEASD